MPGRAMPAQLWACLALPITGWCNWEDRASWGNVPARYLQGHMFSRHDWLDPKVPTSRSREVLLLLVVGWLRPTSLPADLGLVCRDLVVGGARFSLVSVS
jgi:hypothetical protein